MHKLAAFLVGIASPSAVYAADLPPWLESPMIFKPSDIVAGERQVAENEVFAEAPLRWALAGTLEQDVVVIGAGESVTLKAGEILPQVLVPKDGKLEGGRILLCTRSKIVEKREGIGFIAKLVDDLRDSLSDAQRCVEDTDGDGKVDRALVLGEGKSEILAEPIAPTGFQSLTEQVVPGGEDKVTLTLVSVGNSRTTLALNIYQRGVPRMFDTLVSGRFLAKGLPTFQHKAGLPESLDNLGVRISLLTAERKQNTATLRWTAMAAKHEFAVIPRTTNVRFSY